MKRQESTPPSRAWLGRAPGSSRTQHVRRLVARAEPVLPIALAGWCLLRAATDDVPVAVLVRIAINAARGVAGPGPAVADVVVGFGLGLGASLVGMLVGSLFLLRSSRRPK